MACPGGGIGRRAGFRCQWPLGRGSSSLLLGTTIMRCGIMTIVANLFSAARGFNFAKPSGHPMTIHIHQDDLPSNLDFGNVVAIDTETMGLNPLRDRLCLVQLSSGDGEAHLVKINSPMKPCPNLTALLENTNLTKLFHFARFDISSLSYSITPVKGPIYCTKIASKLARTYTDKHGLRDLCRELLQIDISKQQQSSDWGENTIDGTGRVRCGRCHLSTSNSGET